MCIGHALLLVLIIMAFITTAVVVYLGFGLLLTALSSVLLYAVYVHREHRRYSHIPSPNRESFFLGHIPTFKKYDDSGRTLMDVFTDWHLECGPILVIFLLHRAVVFAVHPDVVKDLMVTGNHPKPPKAYRSFQYMFGSRYMGFGLISEVDHAQWSRKRNALNPAFNRKFLMKFMCQFNEKSDALMDHISDIADEKTPIKMLDLFERLTMDIIAKVAFDIDLGAIFDASQPLSQAVSSTFNAVAHLIRNPQDQINPFAAAFREKVRGACKLLRTTGNKCVQERIKQMNSENSDHQDILTYIIKSTNIDDDFEVQLEEMVDEFVTIFVAGMETTANQLSFSLMEICKHPEILGRIREETDAILQQKNDISFEALNNLQYLGQVLKETLRLYPPVFAGTRILCNDVNYLGFHIPAGTEATVNTYLMCRMEEYYENALQFDPDRFASDRERPMYTYFPFSLGPRICIGQHLSQMEAKVVMAKLLHKFDFHLVPGQSFELLERATLKPKDGVMVTISPRITPTLTTK